MLNGRATKILVITCYLAIVHPVPGVQHLRLDRSMFFVVIFIQQESTKDLTPLILFFFHRFFFSLETWCYSSGQMT